MRLNVVSALLSPFLFAVIATGTPPKTGRELLAKMNSKIAADRDYALAFISGVYAANTGNFLSPTSDELKKIVQGAKEYLEANPKRLDEPVSKLLREYFDKATSAQAIKKKRLPRQPRS